MVIEPVFEPIELSVLLNVLVFELVPLSSTIPLFKTVFVLPYSVTSDEVEPVPSSVICLASVKYVRLARFVTVPCGVSE